MRFLLREYVKKVVSEAIRSRKKPIYRTKLSTDFDLNVMKKLPSESAVHAYAANFLQPLGLGSSRIVFILSSRKVLKVARNPKGLAQNMAEVQVYTDPATPDVTTKIYDADDKGKWVISDLVRPIKSTTEFESLSGVPWYEFTDDLRGTIASGIRAAGGKPLRPDAAKFTKKVHKMAEMGANKLKLGDLTELDHWGKTPDGKVVILDYGFTESVAEKHYSDLPTQASGELPPTGK